MRQKSGTTFLPGYLGSLVLCCAALLLVQEENLRAAAATLLLWVLPGWAWARALRGRWLVGLGLGTAINLVLTLLLSYLPGRVPFGLSLAVFALSALLPALIVRSARPVFRSPSASLVLLLLVAAAFRFPNLGYSEFQGDEGVVMLRAAMTMEGNEEQFFLHQKGPAEILIPLATWRLSATTNEFWARLPFAWLSLLGVASVAQLGARWLDSRAGLLAGLILAISGLHIAFARIVQNQSFVVLMGLLALLALDDYRQRGETRDLLLGTAFLALSVWGHYDALLAFPAAAVLALRWTPGSPWRPKTVLANRGYAFALLLGIAILALFYVPYAFHPNFDKTVGYLTQDRLRVGGGMHLNFQKIWGVSTVYNSTYYYVLVLLFVIGSLLTVRKYRLLPYAWLAFAVPFGFYLIVVFDPRTHIYTFYAGASLLAGAALSALWDRVRLPAWRGVLSALGAGLYVLCAAYAWMIFVDHTPEYLRTFPAHKSPLYWTSYDEIFSQGLFGFPYRAGWHAIGGLVAQNKIAGFYATNEEQEITDWYTRQAPRTHCPMPDVYIEAENVQDPIYIDRSEIERDYVLAGRVKVDGQERIRWYTRDASEPLVVDEADYRQWWRPEEVVPPDSGWRHAVHRVLGEKIELAGYDLDDRQAKPGGWVQVTLYWRPLTVLERNYQVFTHLYDGEKLWAQHDGAPECTINATTRWEPGQLIPDQHVIPIPPDVPPGPMPLLVGMYDLLTLERLPVPGTLDQAVYLTDVVIQQP